MLTKKYIALILLCALSSNTIYARVPMLKGGSSNFKFFPSRQQTYSMSAPMRDDQKENKNASYSIHLYDGKCPVGEPITSTESDRLTVSCQVGKETLQIVQKAKNDSWSTTYHLAFDGMKWEAYEATRKYNQSATEYDLKTNGKNLFHLKKSEKSYSANDILLGEKLYEIHELKFKDGYQTWESSIVAENEYWPTGKPQSQQNYAIEFDSSQGHSTKIKSYKTDETNFASDGTIDYKVQYELYFEPATKPYDTGIKNLNPGKWYSLKKELTSNEEGSVLHEVYKRYGHESFIELEEKTPGIWEGYKKISETKQNSNGSYENGVINEYYYKYNSLLDKNITGSEEKNEFRENKNGTWTRVPLSKTIIKFEPNSTEIDQRQTQTFTSVQNYHGDWESFETELINSGGWNGNYKRYHIVKEHDSRDLASLLTKEVFDNGDVREYVVSKANDGYWYSNPKE